MSSAQPPRLPKQLCVPVLIFTVMGRSTFAAIPAIIFASLVGLRSRAAPRPRLVASVVSGEDEYNKGKEKEQVTEG